MGHILLLETWMPGIPPPHSFLLKNGISFKISLHILVGTGEHNTGRDGLGGGLEGGIAFFGRSREENSCINSPSILFFKGGVGGEGSTRTSPLTLGIPALHSWAQTAWHSPAWSQCACVLQFWLLANRKQLYTLVMKVLRNKKIQ